LRREWVDSLTDLAANLSLYAATPLPNALSMAKSDAVTFFQSKSFSDWQKNREAEIKIQVAVVNRLNETIRALGILIKK
jgi:hypothetical protein